MKTLAEKLNQTYNLNGIKDVVHLDSNYHGKVFCILESSYSSAGQILVSGHEIIERIRWAEERRDSADLAIKNLYAILEQ